ncbi:MAG: choice-of-anchor D domain-containing protein [Lentisphaeria bacterium]|nr:choice-of-anchor D domain-containing protein [Lentisphaeria bacterium]
MGVRMARASWVVAVCAAAFAVAARGQVAVGDQALRDRDLAAAHEAYGTALAADPTDPDAALMRAVTLLADLFERPTGGLEALLASWNVHYGHSVFTRPSVTALEAEPFTDADGDGHRDEGEGWGDSGWSYHVTIQWLLHEDWEEDWDGNGLWDTEPFDDADGNGWCDEGEDYYDANGDGAWSFEWFDDADGNLRRDPGEAYNDNGEMHRVGPERVQSWESIHHAAWAANGVWDHEPYTDTNGNGRWDEGEPYTDENGSGYWSCEYFRDTDEDGRIEPEAEPFTDTNGNGEWDDDLIPAGAAPVSTVLDTAIADVLPRIGEAIDLCGTAAAAGPEWERVTTPDMFPLWSGTAGLERNPGAVDARLLQAGLQLAKGGLLFLGGYDLDVSYEEVTDPAWVLTQACWDAHPDFFTVREGKQGRFEAAKGSIRDGLSTAIQALDTLVDEWAPAGIAGEEYARAGNRDRRVLADVRGWIGDVVASLDGPVTVSVEGYDPISVQIGKLFDEPLTRANLPATWTARDDGSEEPDWRHIPDTTLNGVFPDLNTRARLYAACCHYLERLPLFSRRCYEDGPNYLVGTGDPLPLWWGTHEHRFCQAVPDADMLFREFIREFRVYRRVFVLGEKAGAEELVATLAPADFDEDTPWHYQMPGTPAPDEEWEYRVEVLFGQADTGDTAVCRLANTLRVGLDDNGNDMGDWWDLIYLPGGGGVERGEDDDEDGLWNEEEWEEGTNPFEADTDGDGVKDGAELDTGTDPTDLDDPIRVPPGQFPEAIFAGEPCSLPLAAEGGVPPYRWAGGLPAYGPGEEPNSFTAGGVAQNWHGGWDTWALDLPFAFSFYGRTYTRCYVDSCARIVFEDTGPAEPEEGEDVFYEAPTIAVLWTSLSTSTYLPDADIFVESAAEAVVIRWYAGGGWPGAIRANVAVRLGSDGTIRMMYGPETVAGGVIGLSSGDGRNWLRWERSGVSPMAGAPDLVLTPAAMPAGLEVTEAGLVEGTPAAPGDYWVPVAVRDSLGQEAVAALLLTVLAHDGDDLPDSWEMRIVDDDPLDAIAAPLDVLAGDDYDGDGLPNGDEYRWQCDPTAADPVAAGVTFDPPAGTLIAPSPLAVALACATPEAQIWYTTNGAEPIPDADNGSVLYAGPLALGADTTLRARAFAMGFHPGPLTEAEYNLPLPGMLVQWQGTPIANGDTTPSAAEGTDFGGVDIGTDLDHTFQILNPGSLDLVLTGEPPVAVEGPQAGDFSVPAQPLSPVLPGKGPTSFTVRFAPTGLGTRQATLSIPNNVPGKDPYTVLLQGEGIGFTVTFQAGPGGTLEGDLVQLVGPGASTSAVTAVPAVGYRFDQWSDGSTENPRQDENVAGDITVTATFAEAHPVDPQGSFLLTVGPADVQTGLGIWDFSGQYETELKTDHVLRLDLQQDPKGKVTGDGTLNVPDPQTPAAGIEIPLLVKGKVSGKGAVTLALQAKGRLDGLPGDPKAKVSASLKITWTLDPGAATLAGPAVVKIAIGKQKDAYTASPALPCPAGMDGTYTVALDLLQNASRVSGNAVLTLCNGNTYAFLLTGSADGTSASLKFAADPNDLAAKSIKMAMTVETYVDGTATLLALNAKAFGLSLTR